MPPTTSRHMLEEWSACLGWLGRVALYDAELDGARRQEQLRQTQEQAGQNAQLMQSLGAGSLAMCSVALNRLVDGQTGALVEAIPLRDVAVLMRAGAELIQLSCGQPTSIVNTSGSTQIERCLREAPEETRAVVLRGLRAALEWQQRHGG